MEIVNNVLVRVDTDDIIDGTVAIPERVTSIGNAAFMDCINLSTLTIPEGVASIGQLAFYRCTSLSTISIPESVTSIAQNTFNGCTSLSTITIPEGVASIDEGAFIGCTSLSIITIPAGLTSIGQATFNGCTSLSTITIPEGITSIAQATFYGCTSLSTITIPAGVTSIDIGAFQGCTSLSTITLPEGVTSIGNWGFKGCTSLSTITLPEGVTSIGNWGFQGCTSLSTINLPEGVVSIGVGAFQGCASLSSINLPEGVVSIGVGAFQGCASLSSINLPEGVVSIGVGAFQGCKSLSTITVFAESEAEFNRIKDLLPDYCKPMVDHNGQKQFNRVISPIYNVLNAKDIPKEAPQKPALSIVEVEKCIEAAETHLERIKPWEGAYKEQKKAFDSLIVELHLHQGDACAALESFQENPNLNEKAVLLLASLCFTLNNINDLEKHKAVIALFKDHHQSSGVNALLTKSVLYLLDGKEPKFDDTLEKHDIDKCIPLALIKQQLEKTIEGMNNSSALKKPLQQIQNQLHLLTHQEMKKLLSISPIKEAFEKELGGVRILPFESFFSPQPELRPLPEEHDRFLKTTLQLIGVEKRTETNHGNAISAACITAVMDRLRLEEAKSNVDTESVGAMKVNSDPSGEQSSSAMALGEIMKARAAEIANIAGSENKVNKVGDELPSEEKQNSLRRK